MNRVCHISKVHGYSFFIQKECLSGVWEESLARDDGRWEIKLGDFNSFSVMEPYGLSFFFYDNHTRLLKNEHIVEGRPRD
jgi:hypothetical protein